MSVLPDVYFGAIDEAPADWRSFVDDSPDDDEELAQTPEDVVDMLGFDPAKSDIAKAGNGVMLGFWLDSDTANRLAIEGGEDPADMHVTLAYIGKLAETDIAELPRLESAVEAFCATHAPVAGTLGGPGRFAATEHSDDLDVAIATFESKDIQEFRRDLMLALEGVGLEAHNDFGYSPHVTLALIDPAADLPVQRVDPIPVTFDRVTLCIGTAHKEYPLAGVEKGDDGRARRATESHKPSTYGKQQSAASTEDAVAAALGLERVLGQAFDVMGKGIAVEVKTLTDNSNDKVTMHPDSLARKKAAAKGLRTYTVVADKRGGETVYYYAKGLGSFRLGGMTRVGSVGSLKSVIKRDEETEDFDVDKATGAGEHWITMNGEHVLIGGDGRAQGNSPAARAFNASRGTAGGGGGGSSVSDIKPGTQKDIRTVLKSIDADGFNRNARAESAYGVLSQMVEWGASGKIHLALDAKGNFLGAAQVHPVRTEGKTLLQVGLLAVHPKIITGEVKAKGVGTALMVHVAKLASNRKMGVYLESLNPASSKFYRAIGMQRSKGEWGEAVFTWTPERAAAIAQTGIVKKADDDFDAEAAIEAAMQVEEEDGPPGARSEKPPEQEANKAEDIEFELPVNITKLDSDRRMIFGWVSIVNIGGRVVEDSQGDRISPETIEDTAYEYVLLARVAGVMHQRTEDNEPVKIGDMIESVVFTSEKQLAMRQSLLDQGIPAVIDLGCEAWWAGWLLDQKTFDRVKSGELRELSLGGVGKRLPIDSL